MTAKKKTTPKPDYVPPNDGGFEVLDSKGLIGSVFVGMAAIWNGDELRGITVNFDNGSFIWFSIVEGDGKINAWVQEGPK